MNRHFSKDIQRANRHENILNITHHQGNANQNHNEVITPFRIAIIRKSTNNKC